ncbi:proton channel OtopLc isoform X8 [Leguminivora glycinivorella]|uniref:proton channel OtopLc isoform X8 n=1 Tax=Leguminivora glycinivorella TaxID=1035111 RepID=UPI00200E038D|nr:proton channel OtopLc isoform X8 [Leguminivora glycinivorella]
MQRCPYIHEMKERLLTVDGDSRESPRDPRTLPDPRDVPRERGLELQDSQVGTIVKLNSDGYGSHTSPARAPLVADECDAPEETDALSPTDAILRYRACCQPETKPKNAKTSLFIISSFIYAKLLVVVCIAYVISDVITHNLPLYYYEGFFTYLYGMSILFLLYVFCFLLQESACCSGSPPKPKPPPKEKKPKKEKEKKTKDKETKEGKDGKDGKDGKKDGKKEGKGKDKDKDAGKEKPSKEAKKQSQFQEVYPRKMRDKVRQQQLQIQMALYASDQQQDIVEMEAGPVARPVRRRKTSQNEHSHGSFFLRIGAIAFGLGTMIYNGLEFGTFFELPLESPCYLILKGVNPVLQMVFTFMQMYFIFMNSRLNIHRFKVIARFGLMHVVATNICVWIRTLVLESLKEITDYHVKYPNGVSGETVLGGVIRKHTLRHSGKVFGAASTAATAIASTAVNSAKALGNSIGVTTSAPVTTPTTTSNSSEVFESLYNLQPQALIANIDNTTVCGRIPIMGTIVTDSAPYLYPFIIEYSLIGAAVIYVMWKHIGRYPSVANDEDLERRLEAVLSRRAAALAAAQRGNRVDCAGASKGLFCGLLLLVASLICLILFFVLIRHQELKRISIYLADVSHCALMVLSILAILIGFIRGRVMRWSNTPSYTEPLRRVQSLKFRSEEQSDLNDILLRVSAFGLFVYAVFSVIAGGMGAFTHEPNLLVMITGCLSVLQVVLQLLFIADVSRRRVHLPEQERSKPARQAVTFLLICNVTMWLIYTFEAQKVLANPVQLDFYGYVAWSLVQRFTLPLCIFHRFHSAVTLAEIWKTSYKARLE